MFLLTFKQADDWLCSLFHTSLSVLLTISYLVDLFKITNLKFSVNKTKWLTKDILSNKISYFLVSGISLKEMLGNSESLFNKYRCVHLETNKTQCLPQLVAMRMKCALFKVALIADTEAESDFISILNYIIPQLLLVWALVCAII